MMTCYLNAEGTTPAPSLIRRYIKSSWLDEPIIREALHDIQHVVEIEGIALHTKEWGCLTPESVAGGVRALFLLPFAGNEILADSGRLISNKSMGDNCAKYLLRLSIKYDFPIAWDCFMLIDRKQEMLAMDYETGKVVHNGDEFLNMYAGRCMYG